MMPARDRFKAGIDRRRPGARLNIRREMKRTSVALSGRIESLRKPGDMLRGALRQDPFRAEQPDQRLMKLAMTGFVQQFPNRHVPPAYRRISQSGRQQHMGRNPRRPPLVGLGASLDAAAERRQSAGSAECLPTGDYAYRASSSIPAEIAAERNGGFRSAREILSAIGLEFR